MHNEREHITNTPAISIPVEVLVTGRAILAHKAAVILIEPEIQGGAKLGVIRQLPAGSKVDMCGVGFSARTVRVRAEDGQFYFAFTEDLTFQLERKTPE